MADLKILVWKTAGSPETGGGGAEPEVEVKIPVALARWIPKMMMFVPKKTKEAVWGAEADFDSVFGDVERIVAEVGGHGTKEIMDIKTRESHVKVLVERQ